MSVPGFSPSAASWRSNAPGWAQPVVQVDLAPPPLRVELEDLVLETGYQGARQWHDLVELQGWWEGPEMRASSLSKPGVDGEHEGSVLLGGRPITVQGAIYAPDRKTLIERMTQYGSVLTGAQRYGMLRVDEADLGLSRQCRVRLTQPTVVVPQGDRYASVMWSLRAADPRRYDLVPRWVDLRCGGSDATVENKGNAATPIYLILTGPLTNPSLWVEGVEWRLNRTIAAGETVIATWADREVWKGSDSLAFWQAGPWPWLRPGMSQVGLAAAGGTGTARVSWRSAWL